MDIKPIETYYNGYRFRSRLEARWAVFFDVLRIDYEYEPEGFRINSNINYLPDFYLPKMDTYVEVKHENAFEIELTDDGVLFPGQFTKYAYAAKAIVEDMGKMFLIVFGDPYHAFPRLENGRTKPKSHLFYVAECAVHFIFRMANKHNSNKNFHCQTKDGKEMDCSLCSKWSNIITHAFPIFIAEDVFLVDDQETISDHTLPFAVAVDEYKSEWKKFFDAQSIARQARFEHGETPTINRRI